MRLTPPPGTPRARSLPRLGDAPRKWTRLCAPLWIEVLLCLTLVPVPALAQAAPSPTVQAPLHAAELPAHRRRAARFLRGRSAPEGAATALAHARRQHSALATAQATGTASLTAPWQPLGPKQVLSARYGVVTGRITAIAIDPSDATGNTVYVGTTGGGIWKSTTAQSAPSLVTFAPLTDNLPAFSPNNSTVALPSLSIGALAVQPATQSPVVLAGTGDPNDNSDSYYGSGLLRSADGGATWTLIQQSNDGVAGHHTFVGLSVAGLAWSGSSTSTVVAAISDALEGEVVNAPDPNTSVRGLYYSTDAGVTWKMSTLKDGAQTVQVPQGPGANAGGNAATSVVWNPIRQRFYAAVRFHGYYDSPDGATWTRLPNQPGSTLTTAACPANPNLTGDPGCPIARGVLAVQPVTGDVFTLTVDANNLDQGLWQDVCAKSGTACTAAAVTFAQQLPSTPLEASGGSTAIPQADYNLALAAVPVGGSTPDTLLFAGTADLFRCSLAGSCALRNTTNATNGCAAPAGVAGAQHALAALPTAALPVLFVGNDGGLWRSTDGVNQQMAPCSPDDASHFQNLNASLGSLAEVLSFAQHPTDADTLLAGLGANGTAATSSASLGAAWPQLSAGEGGTVAIDPTNPQKWTISTAPGVSLVACGNGASCNAASFAVPPTIGLTQVANDISLIDPPFLLDPALSSDVLLGTCRVWRGPATNGSAWTTANAISPPLSGPQGSACTSSNPVLRSLAAGGPASTANAPQLAGSTVLYAGMAGSLDGGGVVGGHLFANTGAGTPGPGNVWTDRTTSPVAGGGTFNPSGFDLAAIVTDPHDPTGQTLYVAVMGFGVAHIYQSTDAGAHWTNIGSNLPDAPANAIVVDPNDPNTLYVALDTGVYVTQQVGSCATANCWGIYGTGLPQAPVVALAAASKMQTGDGRQGELRAATYGRGIWQIPLLTAVDSTEPAITLNPTSLTFPTEGVGSASPAQTITLTNSGNAPLTVTSLTTSTAFNQTNTCMSGDIAPGGTCTIQIIFLPQNTGTISGLLTVAGKNVVGGSVTATLNGTATAAASVVLTPINLKFPDTPVGATSRLEDVSIANTGGTTATLQAPAVAGDFAITNSTCSGSIGPSGSCAVSIVFKPTASGARGGTLTVNDSAGTQTTFLSGNGTLGATDALAPTSLVFGPQQLNTVSPAQQVTLTNSGDVALTLIAATITAGDFTVVNNCGASLSGHQSCAISVAFAPKNIGAETGTLTITDQFRTQTVALSGTGLAPPGVSLAPSTGLSFGPGAVGVTSQPQTVTLTNNGGVPLALGTFTVPGRDFGIVPGSNTCTAMVAVGGSCTLQIVFTPTVGGTRSGALTVTDNAASSPQTLNLTGVGVDFTLTASNPSMTVSSGASAVYALLLTSASGVPGTAALTCTGAPAHATCLVVPASVPLGGGTALVTVTIATGVAALDLPRTFWYAALLPLGLLAWRRGKLAGLLLSACVACCLLAGAGCGSSRTIPPTSPPTGGTPTPTPSGTSNIVVSATSAGLIRTQDLILIVK